MKNDIEILLKQIFQKYRNDKSVDMKGKCLTEEDIAGIIEERVNDSERKSLFEHLLTCHRCALDLKEHLLIANAIQKQDMLEVPDTLTQKAKDLVDVEVGQNILEIILDFKEKAIELIRSTGEIIMGNQLVPVPVLRSKGEDKGFSDEIKIVKTFNKIVTEVAIEKKKPYLCDIAIRLAEKDTKKKIDGFRVTLIKRNREIESSLVEGGKVIFRDVVPDSYKISIVKDDEKVGMVALLINASK